MSSSSARIAIESTWIHDTVLHQRTSHHREELYPLHARMVRLDGADGLFEGGIRDGTDTRRLHWLV